MKSLMENLQVELVILICFSTGSGGCSSALWEDVLLLSAKYVLEVPATSVLRNLGLDIVLQEDFFSENLLTLLFIFTQGECLLKNLNGSLRKE